MADVTLAPEIASDAPMPKEPTARARERKIAVIGGGVSGLSAAYLLQRAANTGAHDDGEETTTAERQKVIEKDAASFVKGSAKTSRRPTTVTVFESEETLGGHALTTHSATAGGKVDLGFQVFNMTTYPHLVGLFGELGVESEPSDMSFSLSTGDVEWGSIGLKGVFAQRSNARSGKFLKMIREILRFGREAPEVLEPSRAKEFEDVSLGEYLTKRRYSQFFQESYVVPMCAAIWSCSDDDALAFPVRTLVRFWVNHHLLNVVERPVWRVVRGRSEKYVEAIERELSDVRTGAYVEKVERLPSGEHVRVTYKKVDAKGRMRVESEIFHEVVFACHSDQALKILGGAASEEEYKALDAVKYQENEVYLHTDETLMPRNRDAWASWNCIRGDRLGLSDGELAKRSVCVTYWVNLLQNLEPGTKDVFVTLNPPRPPKEGTVEYKVNLAHPLFNKAAIAAQDEIRELQGRDRVWFAGAWCGYGFHEDGIKSAVDCVDKMLGRSSVPWMPRSCDPKLSSSTKIVLPLFQRACVGWLPDDTRLRMILPDGSERLMCGKGATDSSATITMTVFNQRLFLQTILRADIGLGECYMNGDFDVDLIAFMDMICKGHPGAAGVDSETCKPKMRFDPIGILTEAVNWVGAQMEMAAHKALSNTKEGSRKNIEYHYDAGNDFYKLFLDETMLYSSAIHGDIDDPAMSVDVLKQFKTYEEQEAHLEKSQYAKIDAIIARADIKPGDRVLEIGCGWGTCAIRMASEKKCHVTGLTLSHEQHAEATARVKAAGLSHLIDIVICDYRDVQGSFDKVVSIEMLEAVGHEHLPTYFSTVHRVLKPGGRASIQVITMPDGRYESYCNSESDFIRAYIFPGGHLPSVGAMKDAAPNGLELTSYDDIGLHYAVTLRLWRERMMHHSEKILSMGYSRKFLRMFEFYFAYCEAAFANKLIYDLQMTWTKVGDDATRSVSFARSSAPDVRTLASIGAICAIFAQYNPVLAIDMMSMAVPFGMLCACAFSLLTLLSIVAMHVSLPRFGRKVSKVKLEEASTATGTIMERSLALTVPMMKSLVSFALGVAACLFVLKTQNLTTLVKKQAKAASKLRRAAKATTVDTVSWALPNATRGLGEATKLMTAYAVVTVARAATACVSLDRGEAAIQMFKLVAVLASLHTDILVVAGAYVLMTEIRDGAAHLRAFTRTASGFPHYETWAYVAARFVAATAFYVFQAIPAIFHTRAIFVNLSTGASSLRTLPGTASALFAIATATKSFYRYVVEAQDRVAERLIRGRVLAVATSAEV